MYAIKIIDIPKNEKKEKLSSNLKIESNFLIKLRVIILLILIIYRKIKLKPENILISKEGYLN